jgi:citrate lyase subunit alpha / citrate CoA-transferase
VVAVTDTLAEYPLAPVSIPQTRVDYVVEAQQIGAPKGIVSGTTQITEDPVKLGIAETASEVIRAAGLLRDGFSYQTDGRWRTLVGGDALRASHDGRGRSGRQLRPWRHHRPLVEMLRDGLFMRLIDVQGFDLEATRSIASDPDHLEVGADFYANPFNDGCAVNKLDCVIL